MRWTYVLVFDHGGDTVNLPIGPKMIRRRWFPSGQ
jgi:hypothetical protein